MPRKFLVFTGPKGSGKTTLIRTLLGIEAKTDEPSYYHSYSIGDDVYVVEIAGKPEALRLVQTVASRWEIDTALLVLDASSTISPREAFEYVRPVRHARRFAVILNKAETVSPQTRKTAEVMAHELKAATFTVSCKTGEGLPELSSWLRESIPVEAPKRAGGVIVPALLRPLEEIARDASLGLTDDELKILSLVDGQRDVKEISRLLAQPPFLVLVKLRKLKAKGLVDLKLVI